MTTTLNEIKKYNPCNNGWTKLLKNLGKTKADDELLSLMYILESNGIRDAIWCLKSIKGEDRKIRLFAVACVREVEHLMGDKKSIHILNTSERFANGEATEEELFESVNAVMATIHDNIVNIADLASYETAVCTTTGDNYNNASINVSVSIIASDAVRAAYDAVYKTTEIMDRDYIAEQARNTALARQKELFIHFFGEGKN